MKTRTIVCLAVLLTAIGTVPSIVALDVKQGTYGTAESSEFQSPMILTMAFAATDRSLWSNGDWFAVDEYKKLGKFTCEGVSIRRDYNHRKQSWDSGLELAVRAKSPDLVQVKARVSVYNPEHNHDKAVTVVLDIMDGEQAVQSATVGPIKAADNGDDESENASLFVPTELLTKQPSPTLRLTVIARNY